MAGHASIYAVGNIMRQLVGFLMLPVYTRFLTPVDYGVIGLITFAIALMEPLFGARLGMAIPKYYADARNPRQKALVVSTSLFITAAISTLTTVVLVLSRHPASMGLFGSVEYASLVGLFAVLLVTQALEYDGLMYIRLQQRPWLYIGVNLVKLIVQLSLNIWLVVFKGLGVMGIAISAMSSSSVFALFLMIYTFRNVGFAFDKKMAGKMFRFCWPLWIAGLAGLYIGSSNRYYLRIFSSMDDVGLFELAVKFSAIISMLIWEPFQQFWLIERFNFHKMENAQSIFQNVFHVISTLLIVVALGVVLYSAPVIKIMASAAFHPASEAVPFLIVGTVFSCLSMYFNFCFFVTENTKWIGRVNYLTAVVITLFYLFFIPVWGYVGAALAVALAQIVQFVVVYYWSRRFYDMGVSLKNLSWCLLIACGAGGCASALMGDYNMVMDLIVRTSIYALALVFILYSGWMNSNRDLLFEIVRGFRRKREHQ